MFWSKIFTTKNEIVAAICDEDILDKRIETDKFDITISKYFYGERLIDERMAIEVMRRSTIGNLIGKNIISLAMKKGFITKENTISIDGVPHAQFVKL